MKLPDEITEMLTYIFQDIEDQRRIVDAASQGEICVNGSPMINVMQSSLPGAFAAFIENSADYTLCDPDLGLEGQYAFIFNCITKLKKSMWNTEILRNDSTERILDVLIGHALIAKHILQWNQMRTKTAPTAQTAPTAPTVTVP